MDWKICIEMDLKNMERGDWIRLAHDGVQRGAVMNAVMNIWSP